MQCVQIRSRLDDLLDGYLEPTERIGIEAHLAGCATCAAERARRSAMREALRQMPAPAPRPGFVDAALKRAVASVGRSADRRGGLWAWVGGRRELWLGAVLGGAVAAGLLLAVLRGLGIDSRPQSGGVTLVLHEPREVGVLIDAERDLEEATITVLVSDGIDVVGFEERREIRWTTRLERGSNLLSLPVVAHSVENGKLVAVVESGGRTRRIAVELKIRDAASGGTA